MADDTVHLIANSTFEASTTWCDKEFVPCTEDMNVVTCFECLNKAAKHGNLATLRLRSLETRHVDAPEQPKPTMTSVRIAQANSERDT